MILILSGGGSIAIGFSLWMITKREAGTKELRTTLVVDSTIEESCTLH
ncbi:MAG TPA: hypothetical protein VIQ51_00100 [Chryseosolibacter sp.]